MQHNSLGQLGDHELKQLTIFKTVVDCQGFSAAESVLNISRPTISNHIANLETRLKMKLCQRGRGGFKLTDEGAVIYEQANQLLRQIELFRNTINNLSNEPSGQLRIALSDSLSLDPRCQLPQIIQRYQKYAAGVELTIDVAPMQTMENRVLNGQLDLAIIPCHRELKGLQYRPLFIDTHYLYCARQHPLFMLDDRLISLDTVLTQKLVHAGLKPHEEVYNQLHQMQLAAVSYFYEARLALLLSGCYIGFLPEAIAEPYVHSGQLRPLVPEIKNYRLSVALITRKSTVPNRARDLFVEAIHELHPLPAAEQSD